MERVAAGSDSNRRPHGVDKAEHYLQNSPRQVTSNAIFVDRVAEELVKEGFLVTHNIRRYLLLFMNLLHR